ncbi:hypothetical protein ACFLSI_06500 [Bacteroidota bacterium]
MSVTFFCAAQNLYDLENSRSFASYLMRTKQYSLAAQEYERIVFLAPNDSIAKLSLIQSYRLSSQHSRGISRINDLFPMGIKSLSTDFTNEYTKLLFLNRDFSDVSDVIRLSQNISPKKKIEYQMAALLLDNKWEEAANFANLNNQVNTEQWYAMKSVSDNHQKIKNKSPFLATAFSTIVPGTGKIYTKNWKDGLFSLLFVSTSAWQSYRGFQKNGIKSAYGWIFGLISIGYYGGNIYGSWKSAKIYNSNIDHEFYHKAENIIFSDF